MVNLHLLIYAWNPISGKATHFREVPQGRFCHCSDKLHASQEIGVLFRGEIKIMEIKKIEWYL